MTNSKYPKMILWVGGLDGDRDPLDYCEHQRRQTTKKGDNEYLPTSMVSSGVTSTGLAGSTGALFMWAAICFMSALMVIMKMVARYQPWDLT
jgi:hypothetical protein